MFLAVSFIMRILVSVGEASILPSAIAIGLEDSRVQEEDDLTAMYLPRVAGVPTGAGGPDPELDRHLLRGGADAGAQPRRPPLRRRRPRAALPSVRGRGRGARGDIHQEHTFTSGFYTNHTLTLRSRSTLILFGAKCVRPR